jgi:hypothetical protein
MNVAYNVLPKKCRSIQITSFLLLLHLQRALSEEISKFQTKWTPKLTQSHEDRQSVHLNLKVSSLRRLKCSITQYFAKKLFSGGGIIGSPSGLSGGGTRNSGLNTLLANRMDGMHYAEHLQWRKSGCTKDNSSIQTIDTMGERM